MLLDVKNNSKSSKQKITFQAIFYYYHSNEFVGFVSRSTLMKQIMSLSNAETHLDVSFATYGSYISRSNLAAKSNQSQRQYHS